MLQNRITFGLGQASSNFRYTKRPIARPIVKLISISMNVTNYVGGAYVRFTAWVFPVFKTGAFNHSAIPPSCGPHVSTLPGSADLPLFYRGI